jgi:ABC-type transporter Mla maintaining outer membrane lipid asymmetry ATPase subunit MlaF
MRAEPMIEAAGLSRRSGQRLAVDHVRFAVLPGEILGLLGPHGAGRSITVRTLTGLARPNGGDSPGPVQALTRTGGGIIAGINARPTRRRRQ